MSNAVAALRVLSLRYQPKPLPAWIGPLMSVVLALLMLNRGVDLLRSPDTGATSRIIADLYGTGTFGHLFIAAGAGILISMCLLRVVPLLLAHTGAVGVYVGYGIAVTIGTLESAAPGGWRFVGSALGGAVLASIMAAALAKQVGRQVRASV